MTGDALTVLTLFTNFLCMAISLWFAIYLMARSHANQLTYRAIVALLALAFFYNNAFTELVNPAADTGPARSAATIIALVAVHDLTYLLLPGPIRKRNYWIARAMLLVGIVAIVLLLSAPASEYCDPRYNCPTDYAFPLFAIDFAKLLVYISTLYNLWYIKRSGGTLQSVTFYVAVLFGTTTIGYSILVTALNLALPRFIPNLVMLSALLLLAYSVARDQTLVTRRTTFYDLPITMLTIAVITGVYLLVAWRIGLPATGILLMGMLAIFTHASYDFVRELLERLFRSQERRMRRQLRELGRDTTMDESLRRYLRRGLAILCHNLDASSGFIAVRRSSQFEIVASLHSLPVGTEFPPRQVALEEVSRPTHILAKEVAWLAPAFAAGEQVALVGIGERKGQMTYSDDDLYWLEDITDEFGLIIKSHFSGREGMRLPIVDRDGKSGYLTPSSIETEEMLSTLAYKPDPELVSCVEEGFRNLHDYSKLGRSPLVEMFAVHGEDHIECGRQVQAQLVQILEKLRPAGKAPSEPLPREWYSYTILHDAYVRDRPARDIMAKLYISEGTYYRTRRKALRGVTRALMELSTVS